jgi:hypothetical protein
MRGTSYALRFRAYGQRRYVTLGTTATKVDDASLSAESINKTITRLGQILEVAVE